MSVSIQFISKGQITQTLAVVTYQVITKGTVSLLCHGQKLSCCITGCRRIGGIYLGNLFSIGNLC